ncbi:hypothetical protein [Armatimonas rosea]|uniref:Uncharacterized protein n=1 Tax=Armatimonas rosea TaxID=685828 RepID=A0A7W9W9M5_ARMRO|nr:hypothetical protein [Armatimonas rosea]MBB6054003.1 hypothetical protein [Armatimonas rosea]
MQLRIFTGIALAMVLGGVIINRTHHQETGLLHRHREVYGMPMGKRKVTIYTVHQNAHGEILVIYSAGKTPDDALVPDANGVLRVMDSSTRTQDWQFVFYDNQKREANTTVHLPFRGHWGVDTKIVPERIAPDGTKYEAIAFRLDGPPQLRYDVEFRCIDENLHGEVLRKAAQQGYDKASHAYTSSMVWYQETPDSWSTERVPAAWTKYGVDVAEATRQLEALDHPR